MNVFRTHLGVVVQLLGRRKVDLGIGWEIILFMYKVYGETDLFLLKIIIYLAI